MLHAHRTFGELPTPVAAIPEATAARLQGPRAKTELHDLGNLLQAVSCLVRTLDRVHMRDGDAPAREILARTNKALGRANALARSLLRQSNAIDEADAPANSAGVALQRAELQARMLAPAGVRVERNPCKGPVTLACAGRDLDEALLNLVVNALAAVGPDGVVRLGGELEASGEAAPRLRLFVEDDGQATSAPRQRRPAALGGDIRALGRAAALDSASAFAREAGGELALERVRGGGTRAALLLPLGR